MVEPIAGQGPRGDDGGFSDRRARLSAKPDARELTYGPRGSDNILNPLYETGGMVWPYTPTLFDTASVLYDHYDPVHANQPFAAFKSVAVKEIVCTGQFTSQNQAESRYSIAVIHFLRTITKMYFGIQGNNLAVDRRGTPPPILLFNAHGTAIYHNVPVIVTNYNIEFPQDIDYVEVIFPQDTSVRRINARDISVNQLDSSGFVSQNLIQASASNVNGDISAWVPAKFTISVTMQVQNTPDRWRRNFNLDDFRTGKLIKRGGWV